MFYLATLEGAVKSMSIKCPKNTPLTTIPVQVNSGSKNFQECLDSRMSYLLVIMNSSGKGLSAIKNDKVHGRDGKPE
jgi:hypothetical protein